MTDIIIRILYLGNTFYKDYVLKKNHGTKIYQLDNLAFDFFYNFASSHTTYLLLRKHTLSAFTSGTVVFPLTGKHCLVLLGSLISYTPLSKVPTHSYATAVCSTCLLPGVLQHCFFIAFSVT